LRAEEAGQVGQNTLAALVSSVPFASGLPTFTVRETLPDAPPATVPRFQVTVPAETVPAGDDVT